MALHSPGTAGLSPALADRGLYNVAGDKIAAPVTNVAAAVGAAGSLTGTYYYSLTFVTAQGETAPWPGTASSVAPSSQRVNLSSIPTGPAGVIARRIYRTKSGSTEPKDYYFLTEIADNTTTTYVDNTADGSLGDPASWTAENMGVISDGSGRVYARFSDQSGAFGVGAGGAGGYANWFFGYYAGNDITTGRRNTGMGTYALEYITTGYQNTAIGTHSGGGTTTGAGNTFLGYATGGTTTAWSNFNVLIGTEAGGGAGSTAGSSNIGIGYRALFGINTADSCLGIGQFAGRYANASRQGFIDTGGDRSNISNAQNNGVIYFKGESTPQAQVINLNGGVRVGALITVTDLPTASSNTGRRFTVSDSTVAYTSANVGATVAGGGSNCVPVFSNGTNWVIG